MVTECLTYFLSITEDESKFQVGYGCWAHKEPFCPGPDFAYENLNADNTLSYRWEASCTNKGDPEAVLSSNDVMRLTLAAVASCIVIIALIVASCLSCLGIWGKKCCWYDCFGIKRNNCESVEPIKGADPEIY